MGIDLSGEDLVNINLTQVKRSVSSPNSGIVYFQFISDFRSTSGGGTDNVRFYKGGALKGGVGEMAHPTQ